MRRRKEDYNSFERNLDIDFKGMQPQTKKELSILMLNLKYRTKKGNKLHPTDKQLDYAWNYLKDKYSWGKQKLLEHWYISESYKKRTVFRATEERTVKGKKYRKGQFIPRQK